jgi:hypothetical protein
MALSLRELKVQVYLAERADEEGEFQYKLINAKLNNRQAFVLLKQPITAE